MAVRRTFASVLGWVALSITALLIALVILQPSLCWALILFLGVLWVWGFTLSHAYIMTHDKIGDEPGK